MQTKQHGLLFHLLDVLLNIVIIIAIVAGIRTFLVSPFQVEGNSMLDTLIHKEYIIINKFAYLVGEPDRGDVVVFRPPVSPRKHYVKRIIGLPGEEVIIRGGSVYIRPVDSSEEVKIEEGYLNTGNAGKTYQHPPASGNTREVRFRVPEDHYFLLGDNRKGSLDSRSFMDSKGSATPFVPEHDIKGKVWFVALPITKIHALEPPEYGL